VPRVFLSYQHGDAALVRALASAVEGRGVEVSTDADIPAGRNIAGWISERIDEADAVVVVVPPTRRASAFLGAETAAALAAQHERPQLRVIPLVTHDPVELPPILAGRMFIDMRSGDVESAADGIVASLGRVGATPESLRRDLETQLAFTHAQLRALRAQRTVFELDQTQAGATQRASVALLTLALVGLPLSLLILFPGANHLASKTHLIVLATAALTSTVGGVARAWMLLRFQGKRSQRPEQRAMGEDPEWTR
jgi:hypothetical protein